MKISPNGLNLIKNFEGLRLKAYRCPSNVWTIGYGHTGADVTSNLWITKERAEHLLKRDLEYYEAVVKHAVKVPITQSQFDALVSLAFNIGAGAFKDSTVLRELNQGNHAKAGDAFKMWVNSGGVPLEGLKRRRNAERTLFYSEPFI